MSNSIALGLTILIAVALVADGILFDWDNSFFLTLKFMDLMEWVAFWR
ncbi:hypothetical protein C8N32_1132 [Rhodovulum imhoffii]|uniref:Uncharacterized protein n=1 Tax=Rhodovulum imhoffii TaxID=365340 RepID=A0A2T5BQI5_9RHOB|nr:hypothetical protein [Rhodovulum imhoffii]PTN01394.1 hypothetical protein C8N32_1132 [Rhodovulum imhoffii]